MKGRHYAFGAARVMSADGQAIQLRYLTTLQAIASDKASTIVFPFPVELRQLLGRLGEE